MVDIVPQLFGNAHVNKQISGLISIAQFELNFW